MIRTYMGDSGAPFNPIKPRVSDVYLINQLGLSIEQKILVSYIKYKTLYASSSISYVQNLHCVICAGNYCLCDRFELIVNHFDGCWDVGCGLCWPVRAYFGVDFRVSENGMVCSKRRKLDDLLNCFTVPPLQWPASPASVMETDVALVENPETNCTSNPEKNCASNPEENCASNPERDCASVNPNEKNCDIGNSREIPFGELESEEVLRCIQEMDSTVVDDLDKFFDGMDVDYEELHDPYREMPADFFNDIEARFEQLTGDYVENWDMSSKLEKNHLPQLPTQGESTELLATIQKSGLDADKTDIEEEIKHGDPKSAGVSLLECLSVEEVKEHISSLQMSVGLRTLNKEKGDKIVHSNGDTHQSSPMISRNECQLCKADELLFASTPIYCSGCGARIKHKGTYYITSDTDVSYSFCSTCYRLPWGSTVKQLKIDLHKKDLLQKKNDDQIKEPWVQCDSCNEWQHQICSLYNCERDVGEKAEYKCPNCLAKEIGAGECVPLPKAAFLSSNDLPKCGLSDFLEQRLFRRLQQERKERAKIEAKSYDEVPAAEGLVVRVVLSVNKRLEVKPQILDVFGEKYPAEIPYRSKVILLFQKIGGVDVCLFGMYVQEFGSDCICPNQRCVYISYLDSIKYFRPETSNSDGKALRTFVYHEILIGYLEYCKKRGFVSCYLFSCPPIEGEDFIFYCHPKTQKTPKSANLRKWYHTMLEKAADEKIVLNVTNLYDEFFVPSEQCASKTTPCLPYFGDEYWGGFAEKVIKYFEQKSGTDSQELTKRTLKGKGHTVMADGVTKDALFMQKLGQIIQPQKENFIVVRLQYICSRCHEVIFSGSCWFCTQCKYFQLCRRCHDSDQRSIHTLNGKQHHLLKEVMTDEVPADIAEEDEIMESWLFADRNSFLSACQSRHYQFDTLRCAKYSSMMILHHLSHRS